MGMGDSKPRFEPKYKPIRDDVLGKEFYAGCMRSCPHPKVIERYGVGGKANVSVYVCRKCRHHIDEKWFGGVRCGYNNTG
jgi:hypothetical protein